MAPNNLDPPPDIIPVLIPHNLQNEAILVALVLLVRHVHFRLVLHDGGDVVEGLEVVRDDLAVQLLLEIPLLRDHEVVGEHTGGGCALVDVVGDEVAGLGCGNAGGALLGEEGVIAHHVFASPFVGAVPFALWVAAKSRGRGCLWSGRWCSWRRPTTGSIGSGHRVCRLE
jgi:hypothetical protein